MEFATDLQKLSVAGVSTSTVPPSFDKKRRKGVRNTSLYENWIVKAFPTDCLFPFLNDSRVLRAVDRVAGVAVPPVLFELAGVVAPTSRCSTKCLRHSTYLARSGGIMASAHVLDRGSEVFPVVAENCFRERSSVVQDDHQSQVDSAPAVAFVIVETPDSNN